MPNTFWEPDSRPDPQPSRRDVGQPACHPPRQSGPNRTKYGVPALTLLGLATLLAAATDHVRGMCRQEAESVIQELVQQRRGQAARDGLSREQPPRLDQLLTKAQAEDGRLQLPIGALPLDDKTMPFAVFRKQTAEQPDGLALFICLHGGGQYAAAEGPHAWPVNRREFQTQISLALQAYQPDGIYFIPRMADDRLGRWWHRHHQTAWDAVIDHAILHWEVSPDRVYLMGISEGGYGSAILAPWMADRLAGANAMAAGVGLANPPANLRNVAFRTDVGQNDLTFDRKPLAVAYHAELDRLQHEDREGYLHGLNVQSGRGHGIDYRPGVVWIAEHVRNPWPPRVVWINQQLHGRRRPRFYWLAMPETPDDGDLRLVAEVDRQTNRIHLEVDRLEETNTDGNRTHGMDNVAASRRTPLTGARVELLLSDALLDLDRPVTVIANGAPVFEGMVARSRAVIQESLAQRPDPAQCPTARLTVETSVPPEK